MLAIKMFGTFEFRFKGVVIEGLQGNRTRSVLGRLLLAEKNSIQSAKLAYELWPDSSEKQARTNLRREIHTLRKQHPIFQECISSDRQSISWSACPQCEFDIDIFNSNFKYFSNSNSFSDRMDIGEKLLSLCNGELLSGLSFDWVVQTRELIESQWLYVAEELVKIYKKNRDIQDATRVAKEISIAFPHKETGYLQLMQLHLLQGNNAMALQTYHQCATKLQKDLGVEPIAEIKNLYASR